MPNPSKRKGDDFERAVVAAFAEHGLLASKMPFSGALGGEWHGDIHVPVRGEKKTFECKRRARAFGTIYGWLGQHYGLIIRDNRCPTLVVLRFDDFAKLARLV